MNRPNRLAGVLAAAAFLVATGVLVASCARKPTAVDPSYTSPEGTPSSLTRLVLWPERSAVTAVYDDTPPFGPDAGDVFVEFKEYRERPQGTMNGIVLDGSLASEFQIMRREANGGVRPLFDHPVAPRRRWPDRGWDSFQFTDANPLPGVTPAYVARGLVNGLPATYSPVSNFAEFTDPALATITLRFPTDTTVTWDPVAGADFYVAHLFQFRQATPNERILASAPSPLYIGRTLDVILGITEAPVVVGRNLPFDGIELTRRDLIPGNQYLFTVSAIDPDGNLIARCLGDSQLVQGELTYEKYAQGAALLPRPQIPFGAWRLDPRP